MAKVESGETALVHGIAGAVGLAAVEFAEAMGCTGHDGLATDEIARRARMLPTKRCFSRRPMRRRRICGLALRSVQAVLDPVGGGAFDLSLRCTAECGRIVTIGFANGRIRQIPANMLLVNDIAAMGLNYGKTSDGRRAPAA